MKIIHIFAPRRHSKEGVCSSKKMASHSSVTSHCEAVQGRHYGLIDSLVITRSGNLILKNGQPSMYLFDGGYASFNNNGAFLT